MFLPWKPIERNLSTHPHIDLNLEGRSVIFNWTEWRSQACQFEMEIKFDNGVAGLFCVDESTYQTTEEFVLPNESEIDPSDFKPIPWPAWRSELNFRKHLYGELGELNYIELY